MREGYEERRRDSRMDGCTSRVHLCRCGHCRVVVVVRSVFVPHVDHNVIVIIRPVRHVRSVLIRVVTPDLKPGRRFIDNEPR